LQDRLDALADRYGRHVTAARNVPVAPTAMAEMMAGLRAHPPTELGGVTVTNVSEFPEAGLIRYQCGPAARVQIRPSGTEPKVKIYAETVGADPEPFLDDAAALLAGLTAPTAAS
jgi:phosphomannomutase